MPELPETTLLARQLDDELRGRTVAGVDVRQPKCLNVDPGAFAAGLRGKTFGRVTVRGKWVLAQLLSAGGPENEPAGSLGDRLCINLGMGGELLLLAPDQPLPAKWAVRLDLVDGGRLTAGFWWFGHVYLALGEDTGPAGGLGPSPLELSLEEFQAILRASPAAGIKAVLMDQRRIAGIGNVYVQDPLWAAGIHPMRRIRTLTADEVGALWEQLRTRLKLAIDSGGSRYEVDIHGRPGNWGAEEYLVAYRQGRPCPRCGTPVTKIKTGSTSTFICSECQKM